MREMNFSNVNITSIEWKDITNESERTYFFPVFGEPFSKIVELRIKEPLMINVNHKSGGHRIIDSSGKSWYIPKGWVGVMWKGFDDNRPTYMW